MTKQLTEEMVRRLKAPDEGRIEVRDAIVPGFGVRVTDRGTKTYFAVLKKDGRRKRFNLGNAPDTRLKDARAEARKLQASRDALFEEAPARDEGATLDALAEAFMRSHGRKLAPKTAQGYRQLLDGYILPRFGDIHPQELRRRDVVRFLDRLAETRGITANRCLEVLRKMYVWAIEREIVETTPMLGVRKPHREEERSRILGDEELVRLLAVLVPEFLVYAAPGSRELSTYPAFWLMLILTGQRISEVREMRWSDIDVSARTWTVRIKGGRLNVVPLTATMMRLLNSVRRFKYCDYVFTSGENPISNTRRSKQRLSRLAGLSTSRAVGPGADPDGWTPHDLRRTMRTNLGRFGVRPDIAELVIAHKPARLVRTYDRYAYLPEKRAALRLWARHLLAIHAKHRREP